MENNGHFNDNKAVFAEILYRYGGSSQFLAGVILLVGGAVVGGLASVMSMGAFGTFSILVMALPAIALFMIYAACANKQPIEKLLTPLLLVKIYVIVSMVLMVLVLIGLGILLALFGAVVDSGWLTGPAWTANDWAILYGILFAIAVIIFAVFLIVFVLYFIFYYVPLLRIVRDMRTGIVYEPVKKIRGTVPVTVMVSIGAGAMILSAFSNFTFSGMYAMAPTADLAMYFGPDFMNFLPRFSPAVLMISSLGAIAQAIGAILLVVALNKFNGALRMYIH